MSGSGGDELFAGYPWRYYRAVVNDELDEYVEKYYAFWHRLVPNAVLHRLFAPDVWNEVRDLRTIDIFREQFPDTAAPQSPEDYVNHSLYLEAKTFLPGLFVVEDKLSMAHSLESRVPFLDNDLVDFAQRVPVRLKLRDLEHVVKLDENTASPKNERYFERTRDGKLLLRRVMRRYVPECDHQPGQAGVLRSGRELVPRRQHRLRAQAGAQRRRGDVRVPRPERGARTGRGPHRGPREPPPAPVVAAHVRALVPDVPQRSAPVIEVDTLDAASEPAYRDFVARTPGALVYHSLAYRDLLVDHLGCRHEYLVATDGGDVRGVLPLMWTGDDGARVYNSLPFYGSHGSVLASGPEEAAALIAAYDERATAEGTLAATMVANPFAERRPPAPAHNLTDERISQVTDLPVDEDALLELIESSARRNVRKARRTGIVATTDATRLLTVAEIHRDNIHALGGRAKAAELLRGGAAALRRRRRVRRLRRAARRRGGRGAARVPLSRHGRVLHARGPTTTIARSSRWRCCWSRR